MVAANTESLSGLPVVVGSSFSGLLVSLHMSIQGIDHVLIGGDEPDDTPRLGESLNECTSPELYGRFSEKYPECFFTKSHISLLNGDYATAVHFGNPHRCSKITSRYNTTAGEWPHSANRIFWGSVTARNLMHGDRIMLDKYVYREAIAEENCHLIKSFVKDVETDGDRVTKLTLEDGTVIENPKYVLDATGFKGIIANSFNVGMTPTSSPQRVVWTHYHAPEGEEIPQRWWRGGTNLMKHIESVDGFDGISWMIPLGDYVSIGVSIDNERYPEEKMDRETVMKLLNESYERRGIDYTTVFPESKKPICQLNHRYFTRDRAYGDNWLLVGNTFKTIWFPSSSGLWTVLAACRMLPHIFDNPHELGAKYERALQQLTPFHDLLEEMIHGKPFENHKQAMHFWSSWLSDVSTRLGLYLDLPTPDKPKVTEYFRFMRIYGWICKHIPVVQRFTWGNFVTRTAYRPELGEQSEVFKDYFSAPKFRIKNFFQCSARWLNPFTSLKRY